MSRLSLNNILKEVTQQSIAQNTEEGLKDSKPNSVYISIHDLEPSDINFYSMNQIDDLKMAIELAGGVKENLIVFRKPNGKFKVVAGHRRCEATWQLVIKEGKTEYEFIPCIVEETEEDAKAQALKEELYLILMNSQREKTDYDKVQEVERIKAVLKEYKKSEKIPGRTRELIAKFLKTSPTQIERRESISEKLTPEFKEELKEQNINVTTAYEISKLPPGQQQEIYHKYSEKGSIQANEIKKQIPEKQTVITKTTITEEVQEKEPEPVPFKRPLNIYVCCEYDGHYDEFKKAVESCEYVIAMGHIPFSASIMLHGFFQEDAAERRIKGLQAAAEMVRIADQVWVFDSDGVITEDMLQVIDIAKQLGKEIMYRKEEHT